MPFEWAEESLDWIIDGVTSRIRSCNPLIWQPKMKKGKESIYGWQTRGRSCGGSQPGIPDVSLPPLSITKDTEIASSIGTERKVPRVVGGTEITLCTQRAPRPPPQPIPIKAIFYLRSPSVEKPKVTAHWACGPRKQTPLVQRPEGPFQDPPPAYHSRKHFCLEKSFLLLLCVMA